jgi:hypothetical protein
MTILPKYLCDLLYNDNIEVIVHTNVDWTEHSDWSNPMESQNSVKAKSGLALMHFFASTSLGVSALFSLVPNAQLHLLVL